MLHSPVAFGKQLSANVMGLWTDPTSRDGSFILTNLHMSPSGALWRIYQIFVWILLTEKCGSRDKFLYINSCYHKQIS